MAVEHVPVPTRTAAPGGETNAYVIGADPALLVDPAARTDALDDAVAERGVTHVAVTHTHPDHVDAVAHYAAETDATVWARRGREAAFEQATGVAPDHTFREGTAISLGGDPVTVLETPGHARDHVCFEVADGAVCCGDLALASGSVVVGAPEGDMRAYLVSLRRLHARDPPVLYPGHGPAVDEPRATLARLVAHRLTREKRVAAAVEDGARTVEAVLAGAYEKDLTGVEDLARATVRAHLEKLSVQGRLDWDPARDRVSPR